MRPRGSQRRAAEPSRSMNITTNGRGERFSGARGGLGPPSEENHALPDVETRCAGCGQNGANLERRFTAADATGNPTRVRGGSTRGKFARQATGGGTGGASLRCRSEPRSSRHTAPPLSSAGGNPMISQSKSRTSSIALSAGNSVCFCSFWPAVIAVHIAQGCLPSNVVATAAAIPEVCDRAMSIPVQAVICSTAQCAPLR